jgi:hypothetical protein
MKLSDLYVFLLVMFGYLGLYNIVASLAICKLFRLSEYDNFAEYAKNVLHKKTSFFKYKSLRLYILFSVFQGMLFLIITAILVYLYLFLDATGYKEFLNISL